MHPKIQEGHPQIPSETDEISSNLQKDITASSVTLSRDCHKGPSSLLLFLKSIFVVVVLNPAPQIWCLYLLGNQIVHINISLKVFLVLNCIGTFVRISSQHVNIQSNNYADVLTISSPSYANIVQHWSWNGQGTQQVIIKFKKRDYLAVVWCSDQRLSGGQNS